MAKIQWRLPSLPRLVRLEAVKLMLFSNFPVTPMNDVHLAAFQLGEQIGKCILDMGISKNRGTPKSSILIGFSIINHPFSGTPGTPISRNKIDSG